MLCWKRLYMCFLLLNVLDFVFFYVQCVEICVQNFLANALRNVYFYMYWNFDECGNEQYWDSTQQKCVAASAYGQACTANYMCQTLNQGTTCNTATSLCWCGSTGALGANNYCKTCASGFVLFKLQLAVAQRLHREGTRVALLRFHR